MPVPARRELLICAQCARSTSEPDHAIEFAINERCDRMRRYGVGNVRREARWYILADSIRRKRDGEVGSGHQGSEH